MYFKIKKHTKINLNQINLFDETNDVNDSNLLIKTMIFNLKKNYLKNLKLGFLFQSST